MCTAISEHGICHLFGRTLDLECSYGEQPVIAPRKYGFQFLYEKASPSHLAIMGIALVHDGVPLYYDATNEAGVAMAGLNFPGNAVYHPFREGMRNVASFELIPWLLGQCETLSSAIDLLHHTNLTSDSFRPDLPASPLHWLIADRHGAVTVESTTAGLEVHPNPVGVLANNPAFPYHMINLSNYMQARPEPPKNHLCPPVDLVHYSRGMGAMGLPGDFSSPSRFVRAVYAKYHTAHGITEQEEVNRFFHIMDTVSQPRGCALSEAGKPISTVYTSCVNTSAAIYYFSTYECRRIRAVRLDGADLDSASLIPFPMNGEEDIRYLPE